VPARVGASPFTIEDTRPSAHNYRGDQMRIQVKGRNGAIVDDELRSRLEKKLEKVARQVSPLAELEIELREERNPAIKNSQVAEATLHLKGVTLRAREASSDMGHSVNMLADDLARQVKRHRDKRRGRREARAGSQEPAL
jgi:putative sigma-54 modulation protein